MRAQVMEVNSCQGQMSGQEGTVALLTKMPSYLLSLVHELNLWLDSNLSVQTLCLDWSHFIKPTGSNECMEVAICHNRLGLALYHRVAGFMKP